MYKYKDKIYIDSVHKPFDCLLFSMGLFGYIEAGMFLYNAYNDGKFDPMINKFAQNYPTMYGRIGDFVNGPSHTTTYSTYGYTPARTGHARR
mgnify:CR=1 FL=1